MENCRILLIDDNPAIHEDYKKILQKSPGGSSAAALFLDLDESTSDQPEFDLVSAFQGKEGVDLAREAANNGQPFSVAFVDMRMPPGMDGLQTITELWKVDPNIQIVICTAYSDHSLNEIRKSLSRTDSFLLLKKPFDSVEVSQLAVALSEKWRLTLEEKNAAEEKAKRLQQAEDSLSKHTLFLELATKIAGTGYCSIDANSRSFIGSDRVGEILQRDVKSVTNLKEFLDVLDPIDRIHIEMEFEKLITKKVGSSFMARACFITKSEEVRHMQLSFVYETTLLEETGCLFGVLHDVTDSVRALNAVKHAALHDSLTGLPNRVKLLDDFSSAIKRAKRSGLSAGLVLIDVDHFKSVNDSFGHPTGDELLRGVAKRLSECVRETDTVSRFGGDEFAIVHSSKNIPTDTMTMLDRIYRTFEEPFNIDGRQVFASISAGVSLAPGNGVDMEQLIKFADLALYRAKNEGKACYRFFDEELDRIMRQRRAIESDFERALADREFELYYQPIISCRSESIASMEALVRWNHPQLGFVQPDQFIAVAEDTGDIVPIGEWVLEQACHDALNWPSHVSVSVNVSGVQFRKSDLFSTVASVIERTGISAERLEIEITERVLLGNNHGVLDTLRALRELGVKVVMDDFGVGYSSLSYLQHFRFDKLKLDRSFLPLEGMTDESEVIIRAIAGLGKSLGMATCAEGVESREQFERIRSEGYSLAQGYLFSRPVPASELSGLFDLPAKRKPVSAK